MEEMQTDQKPRGDEVDDMEVDLDATPTQETPNPTRQHNGRAHAKDGRPKKPKPESKLAAVVRCWLTSVLPTLPGLPLSADSSLLEWSIETLVSQAPKRWVVYEPMVLLPTGSFSFSAAVLSSTPPVASPTSPAPPLWQNVLSAVSSEQQNQLWRDILLALSPSARGSGKGDSNNAQLTHLAVNEGIPLHQEGKEDENILRSPTGLRPLYGDFGPATTESGGPPATVDFQRAFWVSTKQNGLYQTWAPRWSMFSRGNIKEKARLLDWKHGDANDRWAVDLYAGIGYFVFSYAQSGLRVIGWELNPWSAEALRRGAERNGWSVRVIRRASDLARPTVDAVFSNAWVEDDTEGAQDTEDTEDTDNDGVNDDSEPPEIVIFVEDNQHAARRLAELRAAAAESSSSPPTQKLSEIVHVNCGLLPLSRDTWRTAFDAVVGSPSSSGKRTGWLHLHENVGVDELVSRQDEIQKMMTTWAGEVPETGEAVVEHIEQVKTFAPGVWHCVFDVRITIR